MWRDAPGIAPGQLQHLERLAGRQLGQYRTAQRPCFAQGHRTLRSIGQGGGVMWGEYVFGETDIGQIGPDRVGTGVETDRPPLEREALTRWPAGGRGRRQRR